MTKVDDLALTVLPLDYMRRLCGIDPYHFWQMTHANHPIQGYSMIYPHERWMPTNEPVMPVRAAKRGPGRLDFVMGIKDAEEKIAGFHALNTWPGPRYTGNEEVRLREVRQPVIYSRTPYGLRTRWWNVRRVGVLTYTLIDAAVAPAYDATDDVTVTVNVGTVAASEVVICYPDTVVQIRPITVTKSGNVATITLKKWLCGDPDLWETADPIDSSVVGNLLATVDVCRLWVDVSSQILLAWEPEIYFCECNGVGCQSCQTATRTACATRKDYSIGFVGWQAATYNTTTGEWERVDSSWPFNRFPELAYISYMHGMPAEGDSYMAPKWQHIVSQFAAAEMPDYVWDVTSQPEILYDWRKDLAHQQEGNRFTMGRSTIENPFGTRLGQVIAWRAVKEACGD